MKDERHDRQIGDRRGMNFKEDRVIGPSSTLPNGCDLADLYVDLEKRRVHVAVCDRKDFYHQIKVSRRRAISNSVGPGVPASMLEDTKAFSIFCLQQASQKRKKRNRLLAGDQLHEGRGLLLPSYEDDKLTVSFQSVLQGDHAGVEMACASHAQLLKNAGLLTSDEEMVANRPLISPYSAQGLVIDDFFSISLDPVGSQKIKSSSDFYVAKDAYKKAGLQGSDDKDVLEAHCAKVIGAEVNGGRWALQNEITTVASPAAKRYSLSWVSLILAGMPMTTDHLHLSLLGGWTSSMTYRRPFMGLFMAAYGLVDVGKYSPSVARTMTLPRKVAEEI